MQTPQQTPQQTSSRVQEVALGSQGLRVSAQALGTMGMSVWYGPRDDAESLATLHQALDSGVTFFDTAEAYGPFRNEQLLAQVLNTRRAEATVATKWGTDFAPDGTSLGQDGSAEHCRRAIERSLTHLGVEAVDVYYLHRVDPKVPVEESVGAMGELVTAGKVRFIGICEAAPDTIRRAHATFPLTAVQSEYSLFARDVERNGVLETVRELGIGFAGFSPLGRGVLSGAITTPDDLAPDDARRYLPRFSSENLAANERLVDVVRSLGERLHVSASQIALAWVMAQGVVPIAGTKRRRYLQDNVAAAGVHLSPQHLAELDAVFTPDAVAGERDTAAGLRANYR
ncbi:aldo/keto reductase [Kineococcus radiotolerans SRS30216 = ATCC BAA-149]|uniref:Aldo/keto reductase n=1 Tax=Kineococcus radiotolerans (strain ATCC BAA-149 / DSM 14245 / SRS30216) TaxID=266940 RepID=A6WAF9_KINRD|nr:aldo/keto reductase [Kineococcus radiotolerans SRS30216 = ATCC BAA-149]